MTLQEAIQELRRASGLSQQVLATRLGIATRTLHFYERYGRTPDPRNLLALAAYADDLDRDDLFEAFTAALMVQLTPPPGWQIAVKYRRAPAGAAEEHTRTIRKVKR